MDCQAATRGYIFEARDVPSGVLWSLEQRGVARIAARTIDGAYVEPARSAAAVWAALEGEGVHVQRVRRAGCGPRRVVRPPAEMLRRLRSMRAAEWLPTFTPLTALPASP
jgi:hypothetical protein